MSTMIHVAILTVSDTASQDASADKSGPTIAQLLSESRQFTVTETRIVPDDMETIKKVVKSWSEQSEIDLVLTTGGTGFGARDTTPEAIESLIERHASGLVHLLMAQSIKYTPLAALSRPVAGTYKDTLIITLPGSVKAVKENMETLLTEGMLLHAVELIKGGSGKAVHTLLAKQDDTKADLAPSNPEPALARPAHHAHRHHRLGRSRGMDPFSQDPSLAVSKRHRISPYPMVSMEDALEMIISHITPLEEVVHKVDASLRGHVLSEDIYAPQDVPSTNTTNVDGYALRSTDKPGIYPVLTSQTHSLRKPLPEGKIYRINTGGPLPVGADAVIMVEDTDVYSVFERGDEIDEDEEGEIEVEEGEEKEIRTLVQVEAGENVRKPGSDVTKGDLVIPKHEVITNAGGEIGTIAFVGKQEVKVIRKPVVAVLSTGNEIVDLHSKSHGSQDEWGGIWDTNRPSLQSALEGMGYTVLDLGVVRDTLQAHEEVLKKGLDEADILLTTGGTSMGPSDLLKPVIEHRLKGTIHFGRVSIKPGKPVAFATIPSQKRGKEIEIPLFALPGNPASALVTFQVFVVPALRILGGWPWDQCQLPRIAVQVQEDMRLDPRTMLHRVIIKAEKGGLKAYSTGGQRSSRVASLNGANGFVILPQLQEGGEQVLRAKEMADAIIISELQMA